VSVGSALSAALTNRRPLGAAEAGLLVKMAMVALIVGSVAALWPAIIAWPLGVLMVWMGFAWLAKASSLKRKAQEQAHLQRPEQAAGGGAE
jgi:cardiolipin synthase